MIKFWIFFSVIVVFLGFNFSVFGDIQITGTTIRQSCSDIGGTIETISISDTYNQKIKICKFQDNNFRITENPEICVQAIGNFQNPETKEIQKFGSWCATPFFCDLEEHPESHSESRSSKTHLEVEGVEYELITKTNSSICSFEEFIPDEKKLVSKITGNVGFKEIMYFTIPNEIMGGDFMVTFDEQNLPFEIQKNLNNTQLQVALHLNDTRQHTLEISSTQAIPEFPVTMLVLIAGISTLIIFKKSIL